MKFITTEGKNMYKKTQVELQIYTDQEEMLDQIVNSYDLPDKSKAVRCLLDCIGRKQR